MPKRVSSRTRSPSKRTSEFSTVSDGGMFQSRPFVVQSKVGEEGEKSGLKTSLMQAERYGHHLNRMQPSGISAMTSEQYDNKNKSSASITGVNTVIQCMRGRINDKGKVHYYEKEKTEGKALEEDKYIDIHDDKFADWKNAGKRTRSNKMTDPKTATNYFSEVNVPDNLGIHKEEKKPIFGPSLPQIYQWDKNNPDTKNNPETKGKGKQVEDVPTLVDLGNKWKGGQLIDRRRPDRENDAVAPYDVAPYDKDYKDASGKNYKAGKQPSAIDAERDHSPSGESINRRTSTKKGDYYKQGLAISIPSDYHADFSPTFSGRQKVKDTTSDKTEKDRVNVDAENPALATYRDTFHMLDKTKDISEYTTKNGTEYDRTKQIGAARYLFKTNQKLYDNQSKDDQGKYGHGVNFQVPGQKHKITKYGQPGTPLRTERTKDKHKEQPIFEYTNVEGKNQGKLMAEGFHERLKEHFSPTSSATSSSATTSSTSMVAPASPTPSPSHSPTPAKRSISSSSTRPEKRQKA